METNTSLISIEITLDFKNESGEEWQSGLMQQFTKLSFLNWNREFESHLLRRKKLPNPKGGKKPAPKARGRAKETFFIVDLINLFC